MNISKTIKIFIIFLIFIIFNGCQRVVHNQIIPFHSFSSDQDIKNKKFTILLKKEQQNNLEAKEYMFKIATFLKNKGMIVSTLENCDYVVFFDYGIGNKYNKIISVPVFGSSSKKYRYFTITLNERYLYLVMYDKKTKEQIYFGKVISEGSYNDIAYVIDQMLEALFKYFPGESGKPKNINISL